MKTKLELTFTWIFLICLAALGIALLIGFYNLLKPVVILAINNLGTVAAIIIAIALLSWAILGLRSNYQLLIYNEDTGWKLAGTFDSISSIYQYIDEHEEILYKDYKIKAVRK